MPLSDFFDSFLTIRFHHFLPSFASFLLKGVFILFIFINFWLNWNWIFISLINWIFWKMLSIKIGFIRFFNFFFIFFFFLFYYLYDFKLLLIFYDLLIINFDCILLLLDFHIKIFINLPFNCECYFIWYQFLIFNMFFIVILELFIYFFFLLLHCLVFQLLCVNGCDSSDFEFFFQIKIDWYL